MNFHNPKTGPIIKQTYIRQAMQSLIDQPAYLKGPLQGYGHTNYGPVPMQPSNPYSDAYEAKGPWPYAPKTAVRLLSSHGWTVKPGAVRLDHQPAQSVYRRRGVLLLADAQLRRRLDLRRGPVPNR
jgi:ABC-type transport system substrate-binding protein